MQLNEKEKTTLKKLQLLSGSSLKDTKNFGLYLFTLIVLDFIEGNETSIPYFGDVKIEYVKDEITKEGRQANINIQFKPDKQLLQTIGQIIDGEESEIEKGLFEQIKKNLSNMLE